MIDATIVIQLQSREYKNIMRMPKLITVSLRIKRVPNYLASLSKNVVSLYLYSSRLGTLPLVKLYRKSMIIVSLSDNLQNKKTSLHSFAIQENILQAVSTVAYFFNLISFI